MEVQMVKTKRHRPQFDFLEDKILLSVGMPDPAATTHKQLAKKFLLSGSLVGLPNGTPGVTGYTVASFPVSGDLASMGSVSGSLNLADPLIPIGKFPDLNGALLTVRNVQGSVQMTITQTKKHTYKFSIVSGIGKYASVMDSGTTAISSAPASLDLLINLHSTAIQKT
jgi:hypothetical protein